MVFLLIHIVPGDPVEQMLGESAALAVLAFNLLGDAWRDWLDPRTCSQMTAMESSR